MKSLTDALSPQYVVDKDGNKKAVMFDMKSFNELLEQIEDMYLLAVAQTQAERDQETVPHEEVMKSVDDA